MVLPEFDHHNRYLHAEVIGVCVMQVPRQIFDVLVWVFVSFQYSQMSGFLENEFILARTVGHLGKEEHPKEPSQHKSNTRNSIDIRHPHAVYHVRRNVSVSGGRDHDTPVGLPISGGLLKEHSSENILLVAKAYRRENGLCAYANPPKDRNLKQFELCIINSKLKYSRIIRGVFYGFSSVQHSPSIVFPLAEFDFAFLAQ